MTASHFVLCRNYVCPRCAAAVGALCRQPGGKRAQYPHKERLRCLSPEEQSQGIVNPRVREVDSVMTPEEQVKVQEKLIDTLRHREVDAAHRANEHAHTLCTISEALGQPREAWSPESLIEGVKHAVSRAAPKWDPEDLFLREVRALRVMQQRVERLRKDFMCDVDENGAEERTKQHFLLALSALEQAQRWLKMAELEQERA